MPTPPRKIQELTREQLATWEKLRESIRELEDMVIIAASYASDGRTAIAGEKAEQARKYAHALADALDSYRPDATPTTGRVKRGAPVPTPDLEPDVIARRSPTPGASASQEAQGAAYGTGARP